MKNDQWFEVGSKVMRVSRSDLGGMAKDAPKDALDGQVYCVERVWKSVAGINIMKLVGIPPLFTKDGREMGFLCRNFRKVEEIKLCVAAAKKVGIKESVPQS